MSVTHKALFEILKGQSFILDFEWVGDDRVLITDDEGEFNVHVYDFLKDQASEFIETVVPIAFELSTGNKVDREGIYVWESDSLNQLL